MWHRLACGLEDAGFQLWDTLMWLYGQGFPKAQDISKLIDKSNRHDRPIVGEVFRWGDSAGKGRAGQYANDYEDVPLGSSRTDPVTAAASEQSAPWSGHKTCALKPAWEPILCFRAPNGGKNYAELALKYGSGALNVDGGRIETSDVLKGSGSPPLKFGEANSRPFHSASEALGCNQSELGRYPANLALDEEAAAQLDAQTGVLNSGKAHPLIRNGDKFENTYGGFKGRQVEGDVLYGDSGGASRFFYCSKASSAERNAGLTDKPTQHVRRDVGQPYGTNTNQFRLDGTERKPIPPRANYHPTVKPIDLCRWLATLLLPPESVKPRRLLVPFCGSGSEMIGSLQAGWDEIVGVEQDDDYCDIARSRIDYWSKIPQQSRLFAAP